LAASPPSPPARSLESNRISRSLAAGSAIYTRTTPPVRVCCVGVRLRPQQPVLAASDPSVDRPVHGERRQHQGAAARDEHLLRDDEPAPSASVLLLFLVHACGRRELHVKFFFSNSSTWPFAVFFDSAGLFVLFLFAVVLEFLIDRSIHSRPSVSLAWMGLIWLVVDSLIISLSFTDRLGSCELAFLSRGLYLDRKVGCRPDDMAPN
jgi:hypothetical protein